MDGICKVPLEVYAPSFEVQLLQPALMSDGGLYPLDPVCNVHANTLACSISLP